MSNKQELHLQRTQSLSWRSGVRAYPVSSPSRSFGNNNEHLKLLLPPFHTRWGLEEKEIRWWRHSLLLNRFKFIRPSPTTIPCWIYRFSSDHRKSSSIGPSQYLDGRPLGNTGCCRLFCCRSCRQFDDLDMETSFSYLFAFISLFFPLFKIIPS